jgi:hypothetical protein
MIKVHLLLPRLDLLNFLCVEILPAARYYGVVRLDGGASLNCLFLYFLIAFRACRPRHNSNKFRRGVDLLIDPCHVGLSFILT